MATNVAMMVARGVGAGVLEVLEVLEALLGVLGVLGVLEIDYPVGARAHGLWAAVREEYGEPSRQELYEESQALMESAKFDVNGGMRASEHVARYMGRVRVLERNGFRRSGVLAELGGNDGP
ncbi:hypothetical protein IAT38_006627 [Cryptococcus sp. DSM 104549]